DEPSAPPPALAPEAERQVRDELRALLERLAASGVLGQRPDQIALSFDEPAQRVNDLGLLVDSTSAERARDGLRVLGATPGGAAERLGVRAGDVLVAINGHGLRGLGADAQGHALAAKTLRAVVEALPDDAALQLDVVRAGAALELHTTLKSVRLPAVHLQLG